MTNIPLNKIILFSLLISGINAETGLPAHKKTVCLNMIVKNDQKIIERCLESVKPYIDSWVIIDAGSVDGTQNVIEACLKDIPGKLYERKGVDFSRNKNEALELAKNVGDYILFIDADERISAKNGFETLQLDKDCYWTYTELGGSQQFKPFLINNELEWKWKGVLDEEIACQSESTKEVLNGIGLVANTVDGQPSPNLKKFYKDAQVLEKALESEPDNGRYATLLAESYLCAHEYNLALKAFERRALMGGVEEEVYWSLLNIAKLQEHLNMPPEKFIASYCKAFQFRPTRSEPLFQLVNYFYKTKNYVPGYLASKMATSIPESKDIIYVEPTIDEYKLRFAAAFCALKVGKHNEAFKLLDSILLKTDLTQEVQKEVRKNMQIMKLFVLDTPLIYPATPSQPQRDVDSKRGF